jgi:hypothetical protein
MSNDKSDAVMMRDSVAIVSAQYPMPIVSCVPSSVNSTSASSPIPTSVKRATPREARAHANSANSSTIRESGRYIRAASRLCVMVLTVAVIASKSGSKLFWSHSIKSAKASPMLNLM